MMMRDNLKMKSSDTALRVGQLLLGLLEKPMNNDEIFKYFDDKSATPVYTTEVLNKYLNTLKTLGLQIEKINGKYHLLNFLTEISLTKEEIEAFNNIEQSVLKYGTDKNIKSFIDLKRKMIKFFDLNSQRGINHYVEQTFTTKLGLLVKQYEKICEDGQKIKLEYEGEVYTVEPKRLLFFENKIYLESFNLLDLKIKKFEIEKIKLIAQQPSKNTNIEISNSVIFELSGKLASIYKLKEGEVLVAKNDGKIFVKSTNEDYDFLARKLIRYKNSCKIIAPQEFKDYFIDFINKILKRYE